MENKKRSVKVNIFGEDYTIKGDADSEYINQVVQYVDKRMRIVSEGLANKSHSRVAVLAALNIADELFSERFQSERKSSEVEHRIEKLCSALDHSLNPE
ncbi:MAG: cell division protein ZapA [candidate division Zixibacteria bacterium]|nr:cell division protein ZapA [candidate division Zixibacteria bacterium]